MNYKEWYQNISDCLTEGDDSSSLKEKHLMLFLIRKVKGNRNRNSERRDEHCAYDLLSFWIKRHCFLFRQSLRSYCCFKRKRLFCSEQNHKHKQQIPWNECHALSTDSLLVNPCHSPLSHTCNASTAFTSWLYCISNNGIFSCCSLLLATCWWQLSVFLECDSLVLEILERNQWKKMGQKKSREFCCNFFCRVTWLFHFTQLSFVSLSVVQVSS